MGKESNVRMLSYEESLAFLQEQSKQESDYRIEAEAGKHRLLAIDELRNPLWEFRLPLPMPILSEGLSDWKQKVDELEEEIPNYVIMLVQIGAASLGYFEEGEVYVHKTIKKYMKRHKRGKAQISYLKTRGKSKAGSRIRLANTVRFFEEINEKMQEWEDDYELERIIYSCSAQIWGLLFQSQSAPPFSKKDERLIKVPMDVKIPSHEELMRVDEFIKQGRLIIHHEAFHSLV
ncbi:MAG: hypothetical protein AAF696_22195 [Bacteroidota bacterium]